MNNNDILIRLRYALDIKDTDMIKIFNLGGLVITRDELRVLLTKQNEEDELPRDAVCDNKTLESFLNGLITYKRGTPPLKNGVVPKPTFLITSQSNVNNVLLKKVKIALTLTSDDMLDVLRLAGVYASDSELSAILRKEGHRNYKECGDRYARNFLKGLAIKYRE
ncbi:hypothetical protein UAY_03047 [Enterococcus moraviensis ATCC BAA-383]|uniref:Cytoplasmic protein n=1 Tax=Enterococcus moraviensis ATCC BAA-383 TaxID=1158609 RepID=R2QHS7_9ENTE|nr:DUF1456 family protein [Enterococcus moraviensis]EOH96137.1 hypothetical protein UAY_03047 [Enterococcus moraviensis ATCC BAA-383]EOT66109.1 hypothetical protein I586_02380 [Enterococcus moraviensis ATCC BAA-383]OJG65750.1 hypothetical protein RV09_GL001090 [Enterococcus moraviensis]